MTEQRKTPQEAEREAALERSRDRGKLARAIEDHYAGRKPGNQTRNEAGR